ncbi:MAG: plasmid pRiA4b ORF-3 family protein, partial [Egibacteraceae bacterium]
VPAHEVRLDEVLVDPGERLFYTYDFGDDWAHTIRLEAVAPREADAPRAWCTGGLRDGPPEDCGGMYGYELVAAACDPAHPDHHEAITEHAELYGDEVDPTDRPPVPFEVDEVNSRLDDLDLADEWIGAATREELTLPVLHLRETAQLIGLLRKHRGLVADVLTDLGWRHADRTPLSGQTAARLAWDTTAVLRRLGGLTDRPRRASPTPGGVAFARAALRTWPSSR